MISKFKCKNCNCETIFLNKNIKTDEDLKKKNKDGLNNYNNKIFIYNKSKKKIIKEFKLLVDKHNKEVHWYNFKHEWYFKIYEHYYFDIEIFESNFFEYGKTIKKEKIEIPSFKKKRYNYIECPICSCKEYFGCYNEY